MTIGTLHMPGLFAMIFRPHDGSRERVKNEVVQSRVKLEKSVNRFEETVREMMARNDEITGRRKNAPRFSDP